jgi:hypothetical protein
MTVGSIEYCMRIWFADKEEELVIGLVNQLAQGLVGIEVVSMTKTRPYHIPTSLLPVF